MTPGMLSLVPDEMPQPDAFRLLMSSVVPRPIGWISTLSPDGIANLAPFSSFGTVSGKPPVVMFSASPRPARMGGGSKDTVANVRATGEFVVNIVDRSLADAMNNTSLDWPADVSEFDAAGLETAPCIDVSVPRVALARVAMEARVLDILPIKESTSLIVLGRVVRYHIREDLLRDDGVIDTLALDPLSRIGGKDYAGLGDVFTLDPPQKQPPKA